MPSWDDLRIFLALYETHRVGRAAARLKLSPSTVSRRVAALESQLGATLFLRTPEGMTPTPTAELIVADVRDLERTAGRIPRLIGALSERPQGQLRISCTPLVGSYVVLPALAELAREHPDLEVELRSTTDLADIVRFEVDLAIRDTRPETGDELVVKRLCEVELGLFASASYLAARPPPGAPGHRLIRWPVGSGFAGARWLQRALPALPTALRANEMRLHVEGACLGLGLALVPAVLAETHASLRRVAWPGVSTPASPLYLVGHRATRRSARVAPAWALLERSLDPTLHPEPSELLRQGLRPVRA